MTIWDNHKKHPLFSTSDSLPKILAEAMQSGPGQSQGGRMFASRARGQKEVGSGKVALWPLCHPPPNPPTVEHQEPCSMPDAGAGSKDGVLGRVILLNDVERPMTGVTGLVRRV